MVHTSCVHLSLYLLTLVSLHQLFIANGHNTDETSINPSQYLIDKKISENIVFDASLGDEEIQKLKEADQQTEFYAWSPFKLAFLAEIEQIIYSTLTESIYTGQLDENDHEFAMDIEKYLQDYEKSTYVQELNPEIIHGDARAKKVASNPLMAFRMIRRFVVSIKALKSHVDNAPPGCSWCQKIKSTLEDITMPIEQDLYDAVESLLRIQFYNDFRSVDISNGIFGAANTTGSLTTDNILEIGLYAKMQRYYTQSMEWLQLRRSMNATNAVNGEAYNDKAMDVIMRQLKKEHDEYWEKLKYTKDELQLNLFEKKFFEMSHDDLQQDTVQEVRMFDILTAVQESKDYKTTVKDFEGSTATGTIRNIGLCSGKNYQSAVEKRKLRCWYEKRKHPYFKINPLKVELLHSQPPLLRVYEFVGDTFIEKVMTTHSPNFQVAKSVNEITQQHTVSYFRTSLRSSMFQSRYWSHMPSFYKNLNFFTRLNVKGEHDTDPIIVLGYSFGGHFSTHTDCIILPQDQNPEMGNRMATFMVYLNDVTTGGETIFPYLGTAVKPVKGSAVFWYNFLKNGSCDYRFDHASCPVILEPKYAFNVFIHSNTNFLTRRCALDPDK